MVVAFEIEDSRCILKVKNISKLYLIFHYFFTVISFTLVSCSFLVSSRNLQHYPAASTHCTRTPGLVGIPQGTLAAVPAVRNHPAAVAAPAGAALAATFVVDTAAVALVAHVA